MPFFPGGGELVLSERRSGQRQIGLGFDAFAWLKWSAHSIAEGFGRTEEASRAPWDSVEPRDPGQRLEVSS